ncbi:hypothetical protein J5N97_024831 [Dioscorea zingiberensis]|uniref:Transposase-associated domain-containing protein n=1 Tax=Dioscorea zingiberensis TaxID=325984 RepID=A0A9D5C7M6_9LILI|nr:hypothetical protein J5N97_024831 [Dioscorea zingiberensis]
MDKSWINLPLRANAKYVHGVLNFLDFAFANRQRDGKIACPCVNCVNICWFSRNDVFDHLIVKGFLNTYVTWTCHGEVSNSSSSVGMNDEEIDTQHDIQGLLDDVFNLPDSLYEDVGLESTNL